MATFVMILLMRAWSSLSEMTDTLSRLMETPGRNFMKRSTEQRQSLTIRYHGSVGYAQIYLLHRRCRPPAVRSYDAVS